jgi:protein involved in polysaccharide export with SLBB domain
MDTMSTLQEQLQEEIAERGENSRVAQALRNQIMAEAQGKSFQNLYLTGSVKRPAQAPKKAQATNPAAQ